MRSPGAPRGFTHLCDGLAGGPQGSALTNLTFPMVLDAALKAVEAKFDGVEVRAIQDDCDLMGPPEQLFGTNGDNGALQFLLDELAKIDLEPDLTKFQTYLINSHDAPSLNGCLALSSSQILN